MTTDKVQELLNRAGELPRGEARTMLVEEALRLADATGDERLSFQVRNQLRTEYEQSGERTKAFAVFSRCLSDHDRDPGLGDVRHLLWGFKGTARALAEFPEIPLDRTLAVLDDMERRYRLAGQGLQPVYMCRTLVTQHVEGPAAAGEWYTRWHAAPRTVLSDCAGCDPHLKIRYLAACGRDTDALAIAEPLVQGTVGCEEQPQGVLTDLLPVLLRSGRLDAAADAHRRAYRRQRNDPSELWGIAVHLEFCARSGNEARGLELLERHLGWLDRAPTPHDAMMFAAAAALLLRRVADTGHGDVPVRRPAHAERAAADVPAATLREQLARYALDLAARFDARNGTREQGRLVRERLAAEPVVDGLPLTPVARRAAAWRPAPEPRTEVSGGVRERDTAPDAAGAADAPSADLAAIDDVDRLLDVAEERWRRRAPDAAIAAWARIDELAGELSVSQRARRTDGEGMGRLLAGDRQGAVDVWRRSADLHAQAGDEPRAHSTISRLAAVLCQSGRRDEGLPLLESAFAWLDAHVEGSRALAARVRLAHAYGDCGRTDEALALLDAADPGDDPGTAGDVAVTRGHALLTAGRMDESAEALNQAVDGYRQAGAPAPLAEAALLLGQVLAAQDGENAAAAGAALTTAVVHAPAGGPGLRAAAHAVRGGWLLSRDEAGQAAEDLIEAVAGFTAEGAHPQAAYARLDLCAAYLSTERALDAAEAAEEAIPVLGEIGDIGAARRGRFLLGNAQHALGEAQAAATTFTGLAAEERAEAPATAAELLVRAGSLLSDVDKDATAAERFGAAVEAYEAAGDPYAAAGTRRRQAMCVLWSGDAPAALEVMAGARAAAEALPQEDQAARAREIALADFDEARILGALERYDEALAGVERAAVAFTGLDWDEAAKAAGELRAQLAAARAEETGQAAE